MRSSFCTIAFQKNKWGKDRAIERPLIEILPILAQAGFDAVEIWADHWLMASASEREAILAQLADLRLGVAMLSGYYDFTSSDESAARSLEHGARMLEHARRLGARGIRLFTGKTASKDATPEQWSRCAGALARLCDEAARDGILCALETHAWNLMDTIDGSLKLLEMVNRPNLKLIFQPSTFKHDHLRALDALGPHIAHVHATNSRDGKPCLLADGDMDYRAIAAGLRRHGFDGHVSIEWFGQDSPAEEVARREAPYVKGL